MKRTVKIILAAVAAVAAAIGYAVYASMPADVDLIKLEPSAAAEYFIEEGYVKAASTAEVFSLLSGKIAGRAAEEGAYINAGDLICTLDSSEYTNAITRTRAAIDGYRAQIENLDEQRRMRDSELNASLVGLRGELGAVAAQQNDYLARAADETETANETTANANRNISAGNAQVENQLKLQQILVDQAQATYDRLSKEADDARALYDSGAITRQEYETRVKNRDDAKSALDAATAQIGVIKASRLSTANLRGVRTYTEYYESMIQSLTERIAVLEKQLGEDYSAPMRRYYEALIAGERSQIAALEKSAADCAVTSPVSGKIAELYIKDSNAVNAAMPVALIETGRTDEIEIYVSAKDFPDIKIGDRVEITQPSSSGDIVFWGAVTETGDEAVTRVTALGIDERVVKVTAVPDDAAGAILIPGFSFDVKFFTFAAENQILAPKTAVFKYSADKAAAGIEWLGEDMTGRAVEGADMVFKASGGALKMRQVKLGRELRSEYIVEAGLAPGDAIVRDASSDGAKAGAKVKE